MIHSLRQAGEQCAAPAAAGPATPTLDQLSQGGQLLLWSLRRWAAATQYRVEPQPILAVPHEKMNCAGAEVLLDESLCVLAAGAKRNLSVLCGCSAHLSHDEWTVTRAVRLAQLEQQGAARTAIENLMMSRLSGAFTRSASLYAAALLRARLPITLTPALAVVSSAPAAP